MEAICIKQLDAGVYEVGLPYSFCPTFDGYQVSELPMLDWEFVPNDCVRWFSDNDFKRHFEIDA